MITISIFLPDLPTDQMIKTVEIAETTTLEELFHQVIGKEANPEHYIFRVHSNGTTKPHKRNLIFQNNDKVQIWSSKILGH